MMRYALESIGVINLWDDELDGINSDTPTEFGSGNMLSHSELANHVGRITLEHVPPNKNSLAAYSITY